MRARELRSEMSVTERRLWRLLRDKTVGFKFRRQHAVGPYFLDFYCHEAKLCVELDSYSHDGREASDNRRDHFLAAQGILTFRVQVSEFDVNQRGVQETIRLICLERGHQRQSE